MGKQRDTAQQDMMPHRFQTAKIARYNWENLGGEYGDLFFFNRPHKDGLPHIYMERDKTGGQPLLRIGEGNERYAPTMDNRK
jgi:hypothetical protein